MKLFNQFLPLSLIAAACGVFSANVHADDSERVFASPDEAISAFKAAVQAKDRAELDKIFGPDLHQLLTGDKVQDENNRERFAATLAEGVNPVNDGDDKIILEVGTNNWPMPIPLVKANGQWHFDTDAGKEEIINRHIGEDELCAIGVCRTFVTAERQFATLNQEADGGPHYAQKFKSTPGKKDGLYWPASDSEQASPFGPLVAEAHTEGYGHHKGPGPHPFHGYYFRVLTSQGKAAPGGRMNYLTQGNLTKGFALVAYPEHWDKSGIMTFIVNQDGKVYQRNLAEKTTHVAGEMKEYNPDTRWTLVDDQGVMTAASEKE
jgi:hypothetical protein